MVQYRADRPRQVHAAEPEHRAAYYHKPRVSCEPLAKKGKSRFFQPDSYTSYRAASYWVRFEYPFWWNNLQEKSGLWRVSYVKPKEKEKETAKAAISIEHERSEHAEEVEFQLKWQR